jgi:hypothetical protein
LQHGRLPNARAAENMKDFWQKELQRLKTLLEA